MKRIKRTLALVLACLLLASGTGCAGPEKGPALDIQPEIAQVGVSRGRAAGGQHLLLAHNPVFLIAGNCDG